MIITYLRSSSYNNWDFCQMQYYLNYVLGLPRTAGKKADQGTCVHKVMEILANCKKRMQDSMSNIPTPRYFEIDDEHIGLVEWCEDVFLKPYELSNLEVENINRTRINKYKYKHDAKIQYGTIHYGKEFVDSIFERVYNYYSKEDWAPVDKKDCHNWTWMGLEYKDGIFDPRKRIIVEAEPHFDIEIDKDWAKYEWNLEEKKVSGKMGIKGTIDLVTEISPGIIEIIDFKTGQRLNWASKKDNDIKTYSKLCEDFQLMLYYYAAKHLYPDAKQIIVSIFFIRDGGPFTICMDDDIINKVEKLLRKRYEEIVTCTQPSMQDPSQRNFKCTKICDYYKMVAPDGNNMCRFIHDKIKKIGIEKVTKKYTQEGHSVETYQAPGEN